MHIFAFFLLGIILFYISLFFPFTTGFIFILLSAFLLRSAAGRLRKLLLLLTVLIGFFYAFSRYSPAPDTPALANMEIIVDCIAESSPGELPGGRSVNEMAIGSAVNGETGAYLTALHGREMRVVSSGGLQPGMRYTLSVRTGKDGERRNPGMIRSDALYCYLEEVREAEPAKMSSLRMWLLERRGRLNRHLRDNFESDAASLIASLTMGERSALSGEIRDAFNAAGLAHLLSISGTHFGLFSALIFGMFRLLIGAMPHRLLQRFTMYLSPSQAAAIISLPFTLFYLALSGASIPAVRSFIMINIFLLGLLLGRKGFWLNSLLFAAFIICIGEPTAILSVSFQLSFLAVLYIGYFLGDRAGSRGGSPAEGGESGLLRRIFKMLKTPLILSLAATAGTAPLAAYYFHYFSLISPLSNIAVTPFTGFILVPASLISSIVFIFSGYYPFHSLLSVLTDAALMSVKFFASIPYADIRIPPFPLIAVALFYLGFMIYFLSGRKRLALALPAVSILLFAIPMAYGRDTMAVTYLDVGQGDSAVVEGSGGKTVVVDTGKTGKEAEAYLRYIGKRNVDALVITHADDDHSGGTAHIMKKFRVMEVWDSGLITYPDGFLKSAMHRRLERGDEVSARGLTVQVLHPYKGFSTFSDDEAVSENNDSLVLKVTGMKNSFLFPADTAEEAEEDMLHLGAWLKSDVLKVSHHGSRTSSTENFLSAVSPAIGVISVGRNNSYGHPHYETLERFQGVKLYRTDMDGAVKITETPEGLSVKTYREFIFERTGGAAAEWRNIKRLFAKW
jgi:competence protein ComEC